MTKRPLPTGIIEVVFSAKYAKEPKYCWENNCVTGHDEKTSTPFNLNEIDNYGLWSFFGKPTIGPFIGANANTIGNP